MRSPPQLDLETSSDMQRNKYIGLKLLYEPFSMFQGYMRVIFFGLKPTSLPRELLI